jgi:hypothetical protein
MARFVCVNLRHSNERFVSDAYSRIRTGVIPTTTQKDETPHAEQRHTTHRVKSFIHLLTLSVCLSYVFLPIYLYVFLSIFWSLCLSVYVSVYLFFCLSLSLCVSVYLFTYLYMSVNLSIYLPICQSANLPICLSVALYPFVYLQVYLSFCLSAYLYFCRQTIGQKNRWWSVSQPDRQTYKHRDSCTSEKKNILKRETGE